MGPGRDPVDRAHPSTTLGSRSHGAVTLCSPGDVHVIVWGRSASSFADRSWNRIDQRYQHVGWEQHLNPPSRRLIGLPGSPRRQRVVEDPMAGTKVSQETKTRPKPDEERIQSSKKSGTLWCTVPRKLTARIRAMKRREVGSTVGANRGPIEDRGDGFRDNYVLWYLWFRTRMGTQGGGCNSRAKGER